MILRRPLRLLVGLLALPAAASAQPSPPPRDMPPIANRPPPFRIYDVNARERRMRRLLAELAGTPALSHAAADKALGELDDIDRFERAQRRDADGRLTVPTIRVVDARLNALSRRLGLREAAY